MLPEGWKSLFLGDVFSFKNGLNGERSLYGAGAKFVNVMDVFRGPRLRHSEIVGEMAVSPRQLSEFAVRQGDVLFNRTSETYDEIALSTVYLDTAPAVFGGFVIRARPSGKALDQEFSVYSFQSDGIRREMIRRGQGAIRSNIGQADLAKVPILLPPLPEQRQIAEILATWDRAIETVEALIANARAQKKALMQSLLTSKHRLPGFSGEWKCVDLKSMGKISSGGTPDSDNDDYWNGDILWTTPTDITALNCKYITDTKRKISAKGLANCSAKLLPAGTLLICTRATIGDMAIATSPISTNQGFKNLTPNASFVSEFLFHLFGFHKHIFIRYACGSTFLELSKFDFEKREFLVPGRAEQQAIANILDDADLEIESFEAEAQTLRQEKSALVQQLLTGKRRVKLTESEHS